MQNNTKAIVELNENTLYEKIKAITCDKLNRDEKEVDLDKSFVNDLGADSLDTVELLMVFEHEFKLKIPEDVQERISTVGDAFKYIANGLGIKLTGKLTGDYRGKSPNVTGTAVTNNTPKTTPEVVSSVKPEETIAKVEKIKKNRFGLNFKNLFGRKK